MKERIVLDFKDVKCAEDKNYVIARKEKCKVEKYPTTWEELKELCRDLKDVDIEEADKLDVARIIIHNADLIYFEDEILMIAGFKKLEIKPQQMWQIIKSLIGDER